MPNLPIPDMPQETTEATDTILGVKTGTDDHLARLPYGADQAAQDAAITATETVANAAVERAGDTMTGSLDVPSLVVDGGALIAGGTFQAVGAVTVPAPTAVNHAVQVAAWDAPTGRYAVQGPNGVLEQGDTGWRDISTELINGWVAGSTPPQVRRVGMTVFYRGDIDGTSRTDTNFWAAPSGFRPGSARFNASVTSSNRAEGFAMLYAATSNGSNLNINPLATTTTVYWLLGVSHPVSTDAWPTTLPGVAV